MTGLFTLANALLWVAVALVLPILVVWGLFQFLRMVVCLLGLLARGVRGGTGRVFSFLGASLQDGLRGVGALLAAALLVPLVFLNFLVLRWRSGAHYGKALEGELGLFALSLYRLVLGNPIRLLGLAALTDGVERRIPDLVARAPRAGRGRGSAEFPGYKVVGTLPRGGSGAQLYLARPRAERLAAWRAEGKADPAEVVIKAFALDNGSTLPQIVRENRALEAASRLGLVLEHELTPTRFHYVMPYVAGRDLDEVMAKVHAASPSEGLSNRDLRLVMSYTVDLLENLAGFHRGGLWHKDVKPSNLIVSKGRVHLVDLGLVTPLDSGLTLTTHGTEYYRDPEMVRLALQGVKVHEIDGVKFDVYSAGAVLYSMVEGSFPAHGSLSHLTRRCPDALQWIIRRAMADLRTRYGSAQEMLADVAVLLAARDPFELKPAHLPSVKAGANAGPERAAGAQSARRGPSPVATPAFERSDIPQVSPPAGGQRRLGRAVLAAGIVGVLAYGTQRGHWGAGEGSAFQGATSSVRRAGATIQQMRAVGSAPEVGSVELRAADEALVELWNAQLATLLPGEARGLEVLVLEDLPSSGDPRLMPALGVALERRGCRTIAGRAQDLDDERTIRLAAGARMAVGLGDPSDAEAVRALQGFLDREDGLGAILWVAGGPRPGTCTFRLLRPSARELAEPGVLSLLGSGAER